MSRMPLDLTPYTDCAADEMIGITPLAAGWLDRRRPFETGDVSARFLDKLKQFCTAAHTVNHAPKARPCPLCNDAVMLDDGQLGGAEIRAIGEEEIFAAPDLIYHYVSVHQYRPPQSFIDAILHGTQPDSAEHRALVNTLNTL